MQIFPRELNYLKHVLGAAGGLGTIGLVLGVWYYASPKNLYVGYQPTQPIPYSHRLHAGELGIDCRYCHANVERTFEAMVPPTQTCMGCHRLVKADSPNLAPLRESWDSGDPVEWVRVHRLPDHAYFDHSTHLAGQPCGPLGEGECAIGCQSCHDRVDQMVEVRIATPMSMGWCLTCHRDPAPSLRPVDRITDMTWEPSEDWLATLEDPAARAEVASHFTPPTHCSGCHR
jgi:hypothetical protein